jgi:hypothetical protein
VALVSTWIAGSAASTVNLITSGAFGECPDVNPHRPPQDRIRRELLAALPGFRVRSVIRSIDQFGQLCMVEVSVRGGGGAVAVLRVERPHELALVACCGRPQDVTVSRNHRATGYVAGTPGRTGWTVALGWSDPRGRLETKPLVRVVRAESRHW